jgi:acetate kinase
MFILSINSGSTSLKCCLFNCPDEGSVDQAVEPSWQAEIAWRSESEGELKLRSKEHESKETVKGNSREEITCRLLARLWSEDGVIAGQNEVVAVANRVVHGGPKYSATTVLDAKVIADLGELTSLAPNHVPENLRGILAGQKVFPKAIHVAVFDTAFHHTMPITSAIYPLPYEWYERDQIRRYGFHGISHQYLSRQAAKMLSGSNKNLKLITCHLGGGSSLAAVEGGICKDTTMGFTPMEGLVMQTRSGSLDPGLIMHLLTHGSYTIEKLDTVLFKESGLKALSGLSGDMKEIQAAMQDGNMRAQLAFDVFVQKVAQYVGFLVPILGGLQALVFAGGIGENSSGVRQAVCRMLTHLGVEIDQLKNETGKGDHDISSQQSKVKVLVIHTKEEWSMAQSAVEVLSRLNRMAR